MEGGIQGITEGIYSDGMERQMERGGRKTEDDTGLSSQLETHKHTQKRVCELKRCLPPSMCANMCVFGSSFDVCHGAIKVYTGDVCH